jgi:hypothetical protein
MKKLLVAVSCVATLAVGVQASANTRREAVKGTAQAVRGGEAAATAGRSAVNAGTRGAQLESTGAAAKAGTAAAGSSLDSLLGGSSQALKSTANAQKNDGAAQCQLDNGAGAQTGVLAASLCSLDLSAEAKSVAKKIADKAGVVLQGHGVNVRTANDAQIVNSTRAAIGEFANEIKASFAEAKDRFVQVCNQCGTFASRNCAAAASL